MEEIRQKIEVLAPQYLKVLKFSGNRTSRVLKLIPTLIREKFRISSTNFFEDIIRWDNSSENNMFYGAWRGKDGKDARTTLWIDIRTQGEQHEKTKKGIVTVWLRAYLISKFKYSNPFIRELLRAYSYYFYSERRRKYVEEAKKYLDILERDLRAQLEAGE